MPSASSATAIPRPTSDDSWRGSPRCSPSTGSSSTPTGPRETALDGEGRDALPARAAAAARGARRSGAAAGVVDSAAGPHPGEPGCPRGARTGARSRAGCSRRPRSRRSTGGLPSATPSSASPSSASSRPRSSPSSGSQAAGMRSAAPMSSARSWFLERRRDGGGVVELMRAVSGVETDAAGLELGVVELDVHVARLLGSGERALPARRGRRAAMALDPFPFQDAGTAGSAPRRPRPRRVLADDMGLGKTVQLIALLVSDREDAGRRRPARRSSSAHVASLGNWEREIARFAPSPARARPSRAERAGGTACAAAAAGATSCSPRTRSRARRDDLAAVGWDRLVLDEAQDVKNPATQRPRAVRALAARARSRSPARRREPPGRAVVDPRLRQPRAARRRATFTAPFAVPIERYGDEQAPTGCARLVRPFLLRRTKSDPRSSPDLPPKHEHEGRLHAHPRAGHALPGGGGPTLPRIEEHATASSAAAPCSRCSRQLKQICNHPAQLPRRRRGRSAGRSGKLERLDELLEEIVAAGDKALVFTQFARWATGSSPHLARRSASRSPFLHGGVPRGARDEMRRAFQRARRARASSCSRSRPAAPGST